MKTILTLLFGFARCFLRPVQQFANEVIADSKAAVSLFLANQFSPDKENWVQASPFGDFANVDKSGKRVIQRFRKEDAEAICNEFDGVGRKVLQPFGMPFYVGHPDHPRFKGQPGHTDTAAKGRGKQMAVRHDANCGACNAFANAQEDSEPCPAHGLFVKMHWSPAGEQIIANEEFHGHSVNWSAIPTGREKGVEVFRPIRIKSMGFTNEPAIPVAPASLANEQDPEEVANEIPDALRVLAGFKPDEVVTLDQVVAALASAASLANAEALVAELGLVLLANASAPKDAGDDKDLLAYLHGIAGTDPAGGVEALKTALADKVTKAGHMERVKKTGQALAVARDKHYAARNEMEQQVANARTLAATTVVDLLVKTGQIKTADKAAKLEELANATDFAAKAAEFGNAKVVIKTHSVTRGLGAKNPVVIAETRTRTAAFEDLMAKREQEFPNEAYADRFAFVGKSAEGAQLMAQMKRAGESDE